MAFRADLTLETPQGLMEFVLNGNTLTNEFGETFVNSGQPLIIVCDVDLA